MTDRPTSDSASAPREPLPPPPPPLRPGDLTEPVPLRDFMVGIGELMELPPKRPTRASVPAVPSTAARRLTRRRFALPAIACVLAVVAGVRALKPSTMAAPSIPVQLQGEWGTRFAGYDGRRMRITPLEVSFVLSADGQTERYPILTSRTETRGDSTIVELSYGEKNDPLPMRLSMATSAPGRVAIARPAGLIWERVGRSTL
jgi:hypothetical protein